MFHVARQPNKVIRRLRLLHSLKKKNYAGVTIFRSVLGAYISQTHLLPNLHHVMVKHKLNSQGLCAWSFTQGLLYEIQVHYNIWLHN